MGPFCHRACLCAGPAPCHRGGFWRNQCRTMYPAPCVFLACLRRDWQAGGAAEKEQPNPKVLCRGLRAGGYCGIPCLRLVFCPPCNPDGIYAGNGQAGGLPSHCADCRFPYREYFQRGRVFQACTGHPVRTPGHCGNYRGLCRRRYFKRGHGRCV